MFKIFSIFILLIISLEAHKCVHDQKPASLTFTKDIDPSQTHSNDGRLLQDSYQNIRIYVDYTNLLEGNDQLREYIQNQLVPSAVQYYQATLKVVQTQDILTVNAQPTCGGLTPPSYLVNDGVAADLIFMITSEINTAVDYIAYSSPCALSSYNNRPTFGMLSFNLAFLTTDSIPDLEQNLSTVLHEMMHVLGFSSNLYPYYVNPSSNNDPLLDVVGVKVVNGEPINYLNLEPLNTRIRNYFGCDTAVGGYLENNGGSGTAGSHWERRVFMNEYMTSDSIPDPVITEFTLAILEGSGWYQVEYNMTEPFEWGKNEGCSFLDGPCISNDTFQSNFDEYCSPLSQQGCSFSARSIAFCGAVQPYGVDASLISTLNYWNNDTTVADVFVDNCPYFTGVPSLDCEDPTAQAFASIQQEVYGASSRCFAGTLAPLGYQATGQLSYCFPVNCSGDNGTYTLTVTVGGQQIQCTEEGALSVSGLEGEIQCPDPNTFCVRSNPQYCERGCSGRGTCVNSQCQCPDGWTGDDCAIRVYAINCTRCQDQSQNNTVCFGDLCTCDPSSADCTGLSFIGTSVTYTPTGYDSGSSLLMSSTIGILIVMLYAAL